MQIQKVIEGLGFSAKEAKVYLAALSLGECYISDIAEKAKLPRTSAEAIVEKLYKNGLMNFYVMRRYKYWIAENPERLLANLKMREATMEEAMPRLIAIKRKPKSKGSASDQSHGLEFFRTLADASSQPILITNERKEIEYVNAAWEKQFGYALDEIRGENPRIFQSEKTPRATYERMQEALATEKMFQSDEIVDKRKDGSLFNLLTTIFPVRRDNFLFYIQILDDITAKKKAESLARKFL